MNRLRNVGLMAMGALLTVVLFAAGGVAMAQGARWDVGGMMGESSTMGAMHAQHHGNGAMADHAAMMADGAMTDNHSGMMAGSGMTGDHAAMPAACEEMMADPAMRDDMNTMMQREMPMSPEEAQAHMTEYDIPAEIQAQCLQHMAEHHPDGEPQAIPAP